MDKKESLRSPLLEVGDSQITQSGLGKQSTHAVKPKEMFIAKDKLEEKVKDKDEKIKKLFNDAQYDIFREAFVNVKRKSFTTDISEPEQDKSEDTQQQSGHHEEKKFDLSKFEKELNHQLIKEPELIDLNQTPLDKKSEKGSLSQTIKKGVNKLKTTTISQTKKQQDSKQEDRSDVDYSKDENFLNAMLDLLLQKKDSSLVSSSNNDEEYEEEKKFLEEKINMYKPEVKYYKDNNWNDFEPTNQDDKKIGGVECIFEHLFKGTNENNQETIVKNEQFLKKHRSLLCTGNFDTKGWMIEATQYFEDKEKDNKYYLVLDLSHFDVKNNNKQRNQDPFTLNKFSEKTTNELKTKNSQWLFNQTQIRDRLLFFSIEEADDKKNIKLKLNRVLLDGEFKDNDIKEWDLDKNKLFGIETKENQEAEKQSETETKDNQEAEKQPVSETKENKEAEKQPDTKTKKQLLGAILIPNVFDSDTPHEQKSWKTLDLYFALITGDLDSNSNSVEYHIRHLSDPDKIIFSKGKNKASQEQSVCKNINIGEKGLQDNDLVAVKLDANKMFEQMLLNNHITQSKFEEVMKKIELPTIIMKNLNDGILERLKDKAGKDMLSRIQDKKNHEHYHTDPKSFVVVYGFINRVKLFEIEDFDILQEVSHLRAWENKETILSQDEIKKAKDMLQESLKMLSIENSCRMVNFDSNEERPDVQSKIRCRGQVDFIKTLISYQRQEAQKQKEKQNTAENCQNEQQLRSNTQQIESGYVSNKALQKLHWFEELQDFNCACFIDSINRELSMLFYNSKNNDTQVYLKINLPNQEQLHSATKSDEVTFLDLIKPSSYNKMFLETLRLKQKDQFTQKFIITKRLDNICRDLDHVLYLKGKHLYTSEYQCEIIPNMMSKLNIRYEDAQKSKLSIGKDNDYFIIAEVYKKGLDQDNFIYNTQNIYKNENSESKSYKKLNYDLKYDLDVSQYQKQENESGQLNQKHENKFRKFIFEDSYLILQNVITVEDDRDEVPILSVGTKFEGIQFLIWRNEQVVAMTPLYINGQHILDSMDNKMNKKNYQQVIQFCASSDVQLGHSEDNNENYFFQNYTIVIHYMKQSRFAMFEYQVKWIPIPDEKDYKIKLTLIKIRDVVLQENNSQQCVKGFCVVPLYELHSNNDKKNEVYKINGIQLILKLENQKQSYINFRSLVNGEQTEVNDQLQEINYQKRLIYGQTKRINRFHLKGIFVETQFKHTVANDFQSDFVNSDIFSDWESYQILNEANHNLLNSLPIDFIGIMDVPQILFEYQHKNLKPGEADIEILEVKKLFQQNYKRFFYSCEILNGEIIFDTFATQKVKRKAANLGLGCLGKFLLRFSGNNDSDDGEFKTKRDPFQIKMFLNTMSDQQEDEYYDYKYIRNLNAPMFALSIIDRVLINDEKTTRYYLFKQQGLLMSGKDVIQMDLNQESNIIKPLNDDDNMIVDIYLGQLFSNNKFTENKYAQIMRIMHTALQKDEFQSNQFFQFFEYNFEDQIDEIMVMARQSDLNSYFIDRDIENETHLEISQNQIKFAQFLPDKYQDLIDRYTNEKLQVFTEKLSKCSWDYTTCDIDKQAFKLLKSLYNPIGSKFEVLATNIDFKPYILGMKIHLMRDNFKENKQQIKNIQFDNYDLAVLVKQILYLTEGKIEDQKVIRDIIDYQFKKTQRFYYAQFFIYGCFYFVPFWLQLTNEDEARVKLYNYMCLVVQIIFILYEILQMLAQNKEDGFNWQIIKDLITKYFSTIWNVIDWFNFIMYLMYFSYRMENASRSILPTLEDELKDVNSQIPYLKTQQYQQKFQMDEQSGFMHIPILNVLLVLISFFKALSLLRCNQQFGELTQLVLNCFKDVQTFIFFFLAWVMIFSKLFQITGAEFDDDEYERIPSLSFYLQTFKASLGETAAPQTLYWNELQQYTRVRLGLDDDTSTWTFPMFMIYIIWVIWFINLMVNMVILLNFLIAIISTSYDKVIQNRLIYEYQHKSELNYEYYQSLSFWKRFPSITKRSFFKKFVQLNEFDLMCLVSSHQEMQIDFDEVRGMTYGLKVFMKAQLQKMQSDLNRRFQNVNSQSHFQSESTLKIIKEVDNKFTNQMQSIEKLINEDLRELLKNKQPDAQQASSVDANEKGINDIKSTLGTLSYEMKSQNKTTNKLIEDQKEDITEVRDQMDKQGKQFNEVAGSMVTMKEEMVKLDKQFNNITTQMDENKKNLKNQFEDITKKMEEEKQGMFEQMKEIKEQTEQDLTKQLNEIKEQTEQMKAIKEQTDAVIDQLAKQQEAQAAKELALKEEIEAITQLAKKLEKQAAEKQAEELADFKAEEQAEEQADDKADDDAAE